MRQPRRSDCQVVASSRLADDAPEAIAAEVREQLSSGVRLLPQGTSKRRPGELLRLYGPRARITLFDTRYYVSGLLQNEDLRFFVAYVRLADDPKRLYPRIFYKDVSLIWRSASHVVQTADENWVGKGELKPSLVDGEEVMCSAEETTDLPLEIQSALEEAARRPGPIPYDRRALTRVLRNGPSDRIAPYQDFTRPRERAASDPRRRIHGGRPIARFRRRGDPSSLRFVAGYEPDFQSGIVERSLSHSKLYGGRVRRFRVVSENRLVQFYFMASPGHAWIGSCQATTTELSSYGLRTLDVEHDEDLLLPAFEYHFQDDDGEWVTQIPKGFAGPQSETDPSRADASPWLDRVPVIQRFQREVLGRRGSPRRG